MDMTKVFEVLTPALEFFKTPLGIMSVIAVLLVVLLVIAIINLIRVDRRIKRERFEFEDSDEDMEEEPAPKAAFDEDDAAESIPPAWHLQDAPAKENSYRNTPFQETPITRHTVPTDPAPVPAAPAVMAPPAAPAPASPRAPEAFRVDGISVRVFPDSMHLSLDNDERRREIVVATVEDTTDVLVQSKETDLHFVVLRDENGKRKLIVRKKKKQGTQE